jgi:uncharacterized protein YjiS (DUF1127 family)
LKETKALPEAKAKELRMVSVFKAIINKRAAHGPRAAACAWSRYSRCCWHLLKKKTDQI